jgi:hypothetical protein
MSESKRSVLIAGAQGVIGRATAEHFSSLPGTKVMGCPDGNWRRYRVSCRSMSIYSRPKMWIARSRL